MPPRAAPTRTRASTVAATWARLTRLIAAVKRPGKADSEYDRALAVLNTLSRKEGIPLAIVGGMAAIKYGYERNTKGIDVVVAKQHLDAIVRVAPRHGIKVIWHDPDGWHKLSYGGVDIDIVPEGARPRKDAPTTIPGPKQLGVSKRTDYARLAGWMETKLSANRIQDRADVVQVMKRTTSAALMNARSHIANVHPAYLARFEELLAAAEEEKQQEKDRGGLR